MNFFKSVFADDDPENDPSSPTSNQQEPTQSQSPESPNQTPTPSWGFVGGLIKTFQTKSESVIETYRRDLQEFSTGLKKETQVFKEVASSSLEVGASKAQESLESVGQAFDSIGSAVWNSTSHIVSQGKDSDLDNPDFNLNSNSNVNLNSPVGRYSRFDAQLRAIQCDVNSFVEEIEDVNDFENWKSSFDLGKKSEEMGNLMRENGVMEGIYKKVVPNVIDDEVFWFRYYYRVHKLEQAETVRAKLVERANANDDDDEEDEDEQNQPLPQPQPPQQAPPPQQPPQQPPPPQQQQKKDDNVEEEKVRKDGDKGSVSRSNEAKVGGNEEDKMVKEKKKNENVEEKAASEGSKDSDISVVSSNREEEEEEDLGWDEIEDLGSDDDNEEKKGKSIEGSNREELRKRLSIAEDDEDLSWDIEDDDEPIKKS